jgi:hypothetical protein
MADVVRVEKLTRLLGFKLVTSFPADMMQYYLILRAYIVSAIAAM